MSVRELDPALVVFAGIDAVEDGVVHELDYPNQSSHRPGRGEGYEQDGGFCWLHVSMMAGRLA